MAFIILKSRVSLKDKSRFRGTSFVRIKQRIFVEIATGRYWYFDYYHKDNKRHYEVFNAGGMHDGEATELGVLIQDQQTKTKG